MAPPKKNGTTKTSRLWQRLSKMFRAVKKLCRAWHINHLAPMGFIGLYMLVGAIFFWLAEKNVELDAIAKKKELYLSIRSECISNMESAVGVNWTSREKSNRLAELVDRLFTKLGKLAGADGEGQPQWTFMAAMYFSGTLFTTIGYGDIACETAIGRIGTIIYSVIGIPLTLITLNELGKFLYKCINEIMAVVSSRWNECIKPLFFCCCFRHGTKIPLDLPPTPMSPSIRQAQKELERKTTHFFKDQRIAQKELVFDYDLKSVSGDKKFSESSAGGEVLSLDVERAAFLTTAVTSTKREHSQQQLGILGEEAPRMHVLVAIFFTVSWLFFCAALFAHVEDWTYGQAMYFVCISLLTVGLGDVKVSQREYMVLFFFFMMIGLSLVSMCINVIQNSIEDFYKRLLMQMLEKGDPNSLRNNRLAKFLLPLLSKEKKAFMMQQVQEEAQRSGMEIPPIFDNLDQMFEKPARKESEAPSEPTPPAQEPEILIDSLFNQMADRTALSHEQQMSSLMIPLNLHVRRDSFQLEPKLMRLIPYIDKELKPEEEERLIKLKLRSANKLFKEAMSGKEVWDEDDLKEDEQPADVEQQHERDEDDEEEDGEGGGDDRGEEDGRGEVHGGESNSEEENKYI
uniref:Potassium channel domain-containing protein n=1 Tax=Globodera rostochiensis TaxID=31243 RepID=A0A914HRY1_GLORO